MNWVAPIKDEATLERFREALKRVDDKYYILFEIGVGTGMQLQDILGLKVSDVQDKDHLEVFIGTKNIRRVFTIPDELKETIRSYTAGKRPDACLLEGYGGSGNPLSREQAYRVFRNCGKELGLNSIGAQTMRKTFAWHYYKNTGDIYYLQNLLNHASPSITYRYIGEKPNVEIRLMKLTPEENERSRRNLFQDESGRKRIERLTRFFESLKDELEDPSHNDAYFGRLDSLLTEAEELASHFKE